VLSFFIFLNKMQWRTEARIIIQWYTNALIKMYCALLTRCGSVFCIFRAMFKNPVEWMAWVTGKKFMRSDTAAIYQFMNPRLNNGFNVKIIWQGKTVNTNAEFHNTGGAIMRIDGEIFNVKKLHMGSADAQPPNKDMIYTILKGEEVRFQAL